jgi:hypothetical protein
MYFYNISCFYFSHFSGQPMNDRLKGYMLFENRNPQRLLMGIADREMVPTWSLADSYMLNNQTRFVQVLTTYLG